MDFDFDDCYWHDSLLESIYIDRTNPGNDHDAVEIIVKWYEDNSRSKIIFSGAYLFKATMNFGIRAKESIDQAYIAPADDIDLQEFYTGWKGAFDHVKLKSYVIETSSTGSKIKILAEKVEIFSL
jgi:hypothetical protein